jgi:hypothetical protein
MISSHVAPSGGARRRVLASLGALLLAGCGTRSILGSPEPDATVDASRDATVDAAADATVDASPDATRDVADVLDVTDVADGSDGSDAADEPEASPDVMDEPDATPDVPDVMDVPDATPDVPDVMDVPDVPDATPDVPDVMDVPDATPDVPDVVDAALDTAPPRPGILGSAAQFTILAGSTVSNTGLSTIAGEVGVSPGLALVGIPAGTVVHAGDPVAALAQADTTTAYNYLAGLPCGTVLTGLDLGGRTLAPGVYCFTSSVGLTGTLVLDGQGQSDPLFVFQIGSTLVTANVAAVTMINGARPCGVFWQTGSSATIGIASNFAGNIIALASVTLGTGVSLNGRALARTGAVTMDTNSVSNATCADPPRPVAPGL